MLLGDVRTYLRERGRVPLSDLIVRFDASADALREMMGHLIQKGKVRPVDGPSCDGCCKCAPETLEIYEWIG